MPYSYPNDVPEVIKALPAAAQKLWISKFNDTLDKTGDEKAANVAAWGLVRRTHVKAGDGSWVRKEHASDSALLLLEALGDTPPEWIRILRLGENKLADGRDSFIVDKGSMKKILDAFKARGNDLVIDYEHRTMKEVDTAPAAGWIKDLEARDDGLWARVEWTSRGSEFIRAKEYRYFSPVVTLTEGRRVKELLNCALTNFPALARLEALAATYGEVEVEVLGDSEKDKAAQEARATKYGIGIKAGGNVTKPGEWSAVPDSEFADPVNYAYPMPDNPQTLTAWRYWNQAENQKAYTSEERAIVEKRILDRGKHFNQELQKKGADKAKEEGLMFEKFKKILGLPDEASEVDAILALTALKEKADSVEALTAQVTAAEDKVTKITSEAETAKARIGDLEALTNKVQVPMMLTSALEVGPAASTEEVLAKIESFKALIVDGEKAKKDLVALKTELKDKEATRLTEWAVRQGRTTPAELAKDNNLLFNMATSQPETFSAIMESRPDGFMAPVGQGLKVDRDDKGNAVILDEKDREMCKTMGIDEADFLKEKKAAAQAAVQV